MRILLLNDAHFGFRNDNPVFMEYFFRFYEEQLFPWLKQNPIDHCIFLGDLMDRRKYVNYQTLYNVKHRFVLPLTRFGFHVDILAGNHDIMYKNTNSVNAFEFLDGVGGVTVYTNPSVKTKPEYWVYLPWINAENASKAQEIIESAPDTALIFGHLEINGFKYMPAVPCTTGMDPVSLKRFRRVFSGHFHGKQTQGNIDYLGTQYQMNFGETDVPKGFHVYDTETNELEFIENPRRMFFKIEYTEKLTPKQLIPQEPVKDCYVHVQVPATYTPVIFDSFMDRIYEQEPAQVTIEQAFTKVDPSAPSTSDDIETTNTREIIMAEALQMNEIDDPKRLSDLLASLYDSANSILNKDEFATNDSIELLGK